MKAKALTVPTEKPDFYPVAIELEFETEEEMYEFFTMHNYCPISDLYSSPEMTHQIRRAINTAYNNSANKKHWNYQKCFDAMETKFNDEWVRRDK